MEANGKNTIRNRLTQLLGQVKLVKQGLVELREMHKKFTFTSIATQQSLQKNILRTITSSNEDKQNNFNYINQNIAKGRQINKSKQSKQSLKLMTKPILVDDNLQSLKYKDEQIKNLKAGLVMQLSQIKSMEKKSESMRRTNQKIKQYNSQQKRSYQQSLQKSKQNNSIGSSNFTVKTCNSQSSNQLDNLVIDSKISSTNSSHLEDKTKILRCPKGHQYYQGTVNCNHEPDGNGRLQICCSSISSIFGNQNLKDSLFYQGQFKDGKFNGFGTLSYKGGVKYVGQFKDGKRQGKGSMFYNGRAQLATWDNDKFISIM